MTAHPHPLRRVLLGRPGSRLVGEVQVVAAPEEAGVVVDRFAVWVDSCQ